MVYICLILYCKEYLYSYFVWSLWKWWWSSSWLLHMRIHMFDLSSPSSHPIWRAGFCSIVLLTVPLMLHCEGPHYCTAGRTVEWKTEGECLLGLHVDHMLPGIGLNTKVENVSQSASQPSVHPIHTFIHWSIHLSIHSSLNLSIYPFIGLSIHPSIH